MPLDWDFISVSSATFQGSNSFTLTEPVSAQAGDLLVVGLAGRGTVYPTIPSGWTLVNSIGGGNTSTTANSGMSNIQQAYHVRGGSAPTLVFSRAGGDVYAGVIACYRNNRGGAVFDVAASERLAVHSTTATVSAGITTVEDKELIVAVIAGGDNVAVSSVHAITNPKSGSGATSSTDPTSFQWLERRDQTSTVGADVGISIHDALMPIAGATGAIRAIMAGSSRHSMAVAAFRITPAVDATDKLFLKEAPTPTYEHEYFNLWRELVADTVVTSAGAGGGGPTLVAATDKLLLGTSRTSLFEKRVVDKELLASRLRRAIDLRQTDRMLIADRTVRELHRLLTDNMLLFDRRESQRQMTIIDRLLLGDSASADSARLTERSASDGLLLLDGLTKLLDKRMIDKLLARSDATADYIPGPGGLTERTHSDGLFLRDTVEKTLAKLILDKLLIATPAGRREDSVFFRQGLHLQDRIARVLVKLVLDAVLLKSTDAQQVNGGSALTTRSATDYLFIKDPALRKSLEAELTDKLLLKDGALRDLSKRMLEKLFLLDAGTVESVVSTILRSGLDKLLLGDQRASDRSLRLTDKLFLDEPALLRQIEETGMDKLLLADLRSSLLSKALFDKLLIADRRLSVLDRAMMDKLLTADRVLKVLEKRVADNVLVSDSISFSSVGIILRSAVDYVLLADTLARHRDMRLAEGLLLNDAGMRELLKHFVDRLLLGDSASTQLTFGSGLTDISISDGLPLSDETVKTLLKRMSEGLLLADVVRASKEIRREVGDKFLLADRRLSEREITRQDVVLLREIINRALEVVLRESLLVPDSASAQWFPVVIEFMTYVRLAIYGLIGLTTDARPLLWRSFEAQPVLWRAVDTPRMRRQQ